MTGSLRCSGHIEVYIRTISSNVQHPAAASPLLRTNSTFTMSSAFIQIVDDVVGMMFRTDLEGGRIVIWNWKSGRKLVVSVLSYNADFASSLYWLYRTVTSTNCPQISATFLSSLVARTWSRAGWEEALSRYLRSMKKRMMSSMLRTCYSLHCSCAHISCTAVFTLVHSWRTVLPVCPSGQIRKNGCMFFRCSMFGWIQMHLVLGRNFVSFSRAAFP